MIKAKLGMLDVTLTGWTWSCPGSASVQQMLQRCADGVSVHGGIPDVEGEVFRLVKLQISGLTMVERTPAPSSTPGDEFY